MSDIVLNNVSKRFDDRIVLDHYSVVFKEHEITCIMGPSGGGKTTLLNLLAGLLKADEGTIEGVPEKIAFVFQEDRLCEEFSAVANIRLVTGSAVPEAVIREHLSALGLSDSADMPVSQLSGGMKRRAAIARALCYDAELILLDEAFKGLDENRRDETIAYIKRYSEGKTIICVTHDPDEARLMGGTCINMEAYNNEH